MSLENSFESVVKITARTHLRELKNSSVLAKYIQKDLTTFYCNELFDVLNSGLQIYIFSFQAYLAPNFLYSHLKEMT